jgi:hypothetical protein
VDPVVVATCETLDEAQTGRAVLEGRGIDVELRAAADRTEILVEPSVAASARRALLDDRLERQGRVPQEMSLFMKVTLVLAFLAVVAFAVVTVSLG